VSETPTSSPTVGAAAAPRLRLATRLAGLVVLLFAIEAVSGVLLLVYYRPAADAAYLSVAAINDEVRIGWVVRSVHWWAADLLIALAILHLVVSYFSRAYTRPRRSAWLSGILLFTLVLGFGFTGTLLPWDQYAYWSIESTRQTIAGSPGVGSFLIYLFWGGWELGGEVLARFYAFHVGILPWMAAALLATHLVIAWRTGLQERLSAAPGAESILAVDFWIATLLCIGVLLSAALSAPPPLLGPADPLTPLPHVLPRWYFLPARMLLRHLPGAVAGLTVLVLFALVSAVPLIDGRERASAFATGARWAIGLAAIGVILWMAAQQYVSA